MSEMHNEKSKIFPLVALLLGSLALAFAPIFVRLSEISPTSVTFWRTALSVPLLSMAWMFFRGPQRNVFVAPSLKAYCGLVLAGVFFALDLVLWAISLNLTSVANASLLVNFASIFVALISWLILRQPLGRGLILGMLIAITGSVLLVWPHLNTGDDSLLGDGIALLAAFFYGMYLLAVQIARRTFGTLNIMTVTGVVTSITAGVMAWRLNETLLVDTTTTWLALLGLAVVVQSIGQGLIAFALLEISAGLSAVVLLLQPVVAAIIAWHLFEEDLVAIQAIGMGIILAGIGYAKITHSDLSPQTLK